MSRRALLAILTLIALLHLPGREVQSAAPKPASHTVTIRGMAYTPANLTIRSGDSVTWMNGDDRDHTVIAADRSFSSGNIRPGGSFSVTFRKAGNVAYGCQLHPRMRGMVTVQ